MLPLSQKNNIVLGLEKVNITDRMILESTDIWSELLDNDFISKMADGTLLARRYRNYVIQDYLYLKSYICILDTGYNKAVNVDEKEYLSNHKKEICEELARTHEISMKELDISDEELDSALMCDEIKKYASYMAAVTEGGTFVDCISAILACSWSYEYICCQMIEKGRVSNESSYWPWFESYSCDEYRISNSSLMAKVNERTKNLPESKIIELIEVFKKCIKYELDFWNAL